MISSFGEIMVVELPNCLIAELFLYPFRIRYGMEFFFL